jgi:hypothetical protein
VSQQYSSESQHDQWQCEMISKVATCKVKHDIYIDNKWNQIFIEGNIFYIACFEVTKVTDQEIRATYLVHQKQAAYSAKVEPEI